MTVLTFDRNLRYDLAAGRGLDTLGVDPATFEGRTLYDVVDEERRGPLETSTATRSTVTSPRWSGVSGDNPGRDLWLRGVPLRDGEGGCRAGWWCPRT